MAGYGIEAFRGLGGSDEREHDGDTTTPAITIMRRLRAVPPAG
jgi:hypothetical protein